MRIPPAGPTGPAGGSGDPEIDAMMARLAGLVNDLPKPGAAAPAAPAETPTSPGTPAAAAAPKPSAAGSEVTDSTDPTYRYRVTPTGFDVVAGKDADIESVNPDSRYYAAIYQEVAKQRPDLVAGLPRPQPRVPLANASAFTAAPKPAPSGRGSTAAPSKPAASAATAATPATSPAAAAQQTAFGGMADKDRNDTAPSEIPPPKWTQPWYQADLAQRYRSTSDKMADITADDMAARRAQQDALEARTRMGPPADTGVPVRLPTSVNLPAGDAVTTTLDKMAAWPADTAAKALASNAGKALIGNVGPSPADNADAQRAGAQTAPLTPQLAEVLRRAGFKGDAQGITPEVVQWLSTQPDAAQYEPTASLSNALRMIKAMAKASPDDYILRAGESEYQQHLFQSVADRVGQSTGTPVKTPRQLLQWVLANSTPEDRAQYLNGTTQATSDAAALQLLGPWLDAVDQGQVKLPNKPDNMTF